MEIEKKLATDCGKISFENTRRLWKRLVSANQKIEEAAEREAMLNGIVHEEGLVKDIAKRQLSHINKKVFDMAEQKGLSIWEICLNYMPELAKPEFKDVGGKVCFEQELRLVPLPLEIEKGGGYWKSKYYRLKERLQELINNKED